MNEIRTWLTDRKLNAEKTDIITIEAQSEIDDEIDFSFD